MGERHPPRKILDFGRAPRPRWRGGPRRRTSRPRRDARFIETLIVVAIVTFLIVFQTDLGGPGRPVETLVRARPAVAVSAPFPHCGAARAAGADPVYRGDPGYSPDLDGDGDGIGCEPYHGH